MKKFLFALSFIIFLSCTTPVIVQKEKYGVVEDVTAYIVKYRGCDRLYKVWDGNKYYKIYTNKRYNIGDTIKIK